MTDTLVAQFIGQGVHFGINLFAALAFLAAGWLYLDAWSGRPHPGELAKGVGFLLLTIGFVMTGATWSDPTVLDLAAGGLKLTGYLAIAWGCLIEPLNPRPKTTGYVPDHTPVTVSQAPAGPSASAQIAANPPASAQAASSTTSSQAPANPGQPAGPTPGATPTPPTKPMPAIAFTVGAAAAGLSFAVPVSALLAGAMFWRVGTTGLERHLRPLGIAFGVFALAEIIALTSLWQHDPNPILQMLSAPLGVFWIIQHLVLIGATAILGRWVWRYLTKRLLSQLFLTITALTFSIALLATVGVAALLLSSLQRDALAGLRTATKVLNYAIDTKTADTRTSAEVLAQNPAVVQAATTRNHTALATLAADLVAKKHLSDAIITDETGVVLARASDPERSGDSISSDSLVQHALLGETSSSLAKRSGALVPTIVTSTASPIYAGSQIVGLAVTSLALDNTFVDGLKRTTGLDSTVYSDTTRSATTITASDRLSRPLGTKETHSGVLDRTIKQGEIWQGPLSVTGQPYLAVYLPLKDITNTTIGMLFIGEPQSTVLNTAGQAIRLTFVAAALSLILIMAVVYLISRQIVRQLH